MSTRRFISSLYPSDYAFMARYHARVKRAIKTCERYGYKFYAHPAVDPRPRITPKLKNLNLSPTNRANHYYRKVVKPRRHEFYKELRRLRARDEFLGTPGTHGYTTPKT